MNYQKFLDEQKQPLETRVNKTWNVKKSFPNKIPVLIINQDKEIQLNDIFFLIPEEYNVRQLKHTLSQQLNESRNFSLYVENSRDLDNEYLMSEVYKKYVDDDGTLKLKIDFHLESKEDTLS